MSLAFLPPNALLKCELVFVQDVSCKLSSIKDALPHEAVTKLCTADFRGRIDAKRRRWRPRRRESTNSKMGCAGQWAFLDVSRHTAKDRSGWRAVHSRASVSTDPWQWGWPKAKQGTARQCCRLNILQRKRFIVARQINLVGDSYIGALRAGSRGQDDLASIDRCDDLFIRGHSHIGQKLAISYTTIARCGTRARLMVMISRLYAQVS